MPVHANTSFQSPKKTGKGLISMNVPGRALDLTTELFQWLLMVVSVRIWANPASSQLLLSYTS